MAYIANIQLNDMRVLPFASEIELKKGDKVIVEVTDSALEFGIFHSIEKEKQESIGKVLRIASENDIVENNRLLGFQKDDRQKVAEKVKANNIQLKLVVVLRSFDSKKILVMYTAEDRVDFRQLVRDLAGIFHMRVEMRQISERDEAKIRGGCGQCGQVLCCRRFLGCPRQTSIKMAKVQGIALTPNKVNGVCGKLMCCLQYEYSNYRDILDKMPTIGSIVETPNGKGEIVYLDLLRELVAVKLENENKTVEKFKKDDLKILTSAKKREEDDD